MVSLCTRNKAVPTLCSSVYCDWYISTGLNLFRCPHIVHIQVIPVIWARKQCYWWISEFLHRKEQTMVRALSITRTTKLGGSLFTKRTDILPQDFVKSRSREIRVKTFPIALKFDRGASQISERYDHCDIQTFETSRDLMVRRLTALWIEAWYFILGTNQCNTLEIRYQGRYSTILLLRRWVTKFQRDGKL